MKRHHSSKSQRARWSAALAVLVAVCLGATACGSGGDQVLAGEGDGPEYGASLEEWSRAIGEERDAAAASQANAGLTDEHETVDWDDLVAPDYSGEEIAARYAERLADLEDGSEEADALYQEMLHQHDDSAVNAQLDGTKINLAGFVAPLTYDDDIVTEFLLVPYFGACIHVPPPPPHQTVLVTLDKANGLTIEEAWGAVWVAGTLRVSPATTDLATASYTISNAVTGVYDDY